MRRLALLAVLLIAGTGLANAQPPECYHDPQEIYQFLSDLVDQYPDIIRVDSVGHTQQDNLPLYLVKISDNVNVDEDEPTTLIIGNIHAEEILGVEATLNVIEQLVTNPRIEFSRRRRGLEMYFFPTMNPEGMQVVFGLGDDLVHGVDVTYRKNKRDNVGDGIFRYAIGTGGDSSGVDLNRNFDINWFHGDRLFEVVGQSEIYDYYRGPAPFSESEARTVRDEIRRIRPMYGIVFHSSRTGNLSEKVFYPWDWGLDHAKVAPDQDVLDDVASNVAGLIPTQSGGSTYEFIRSGGRNGKVHDWMYADGGWINMEVEVGNRVIQPPCEVRQTIVDNTAPAIYYLLDRALGRSDLESQSGYLEVHVTDEDGNPLVAEVLLPDRTNGYLKPRMTDPDFGTLRRPLMQGNYRMIVRKWGYAADTTVTNVGSFGPARTDIVLHPLSEGSVGIRAYDGTSGELVPATFVVHHDYGIDTLSVPSGQLDTQWPFGSYEVEVWAEGYVPKRYSFDLNGSHLIEANLVQPDQELEVVDDFEGTLPARWTSGGDFTWDPSTLDSHTGAQALKSSTDRYVAINSEGWAQVSYQVPAGVQTLTLTGWRAFELEPDFDFCRVEMSIDGGEWTPLETLNGFSRWVPFFYDLRDAADANTVDIRWTITTDATDVDRGLFLDDLKLESSDTFVSVDGTPAQPVQWALHAAYPNPFNPSTTIRFDVAKQARVKVSVYDVLGREVATLANDDMAPGSHVRSLNMAKNAAGVYFVRMSTPDYQSVRKIVLIK